MTIVLSTIDVVISTTVHPLLLLKAKRLSITSKTRGESGSIQKSRYS